MTHTKLMARKKVKLEWITNDSARRATFKKRKKGLMKKVSELSTLCDIKACSIVYGPDEPRAEVWPSVPDAMSVLARLKRLPEMEQSKKMMNQEGFMRQRIEKLDEQLRKQDKENREIETAILMRQGLSGKSLCDVSIDHARSLSWFIETKINEVQKRIGIVKGGMASKTSQGAKDERVKVETISKEESMTLGKPAIIGKEKTQLEAAMEELQRQEWFAEVMNSHHQHMVSRVGLDMVVHPYVDHITPWLDSYFPLN